MQCERRQAVAVAVAWAAAAAAVDCMASPQERRDPLRGLSAIAQDHALRGLAWRTER